MEIKYQRAMEECDRLREFEVHMLEWKSKYESIYIRIEELEGGSRKWEDRAIHWESECHRFEKDVEIHIIRIRELEDQIRHHEERITSLEITLKEVEVRCHHLEEELHEARG